MKLYKKLDALKLIKKFPKNNRIKSAKGYKSKSSIYDQNSSFILSKTNLIKKRLLSSSHKNKSKSINKTSRSSLSILNLIIKNNPLKYNFKKIEEKAKQINPMFLDDNEIIKSFAKNTQKVLYRYNVLYGNKTKHLIRTYSPTMRPGSSSVKLFTKSIKETKKGNKLLNDDEILLLIQAKCKDIGIDYREVMYNKFKEYCNYHCKNRVADFSECYFGINSIQKVGELLIDKNRISCLNLTRNNLGDAGLIILTNFIKNSYSLIALNITSNSITYKGGYLLFKTLITQQSIIDLNISSLEGSNRNRITSLGLKEVVSVLTNNVFIEILNLSGNNIKDEGFILLCKGLQNSVSLQNLDISNNDIQEKGIKQGFEYINNSQKYSKIISLNISNNLILNGGIITITDNLKYFPHLKIISLAFCGIEFKGFIYFLETVQYLKRFEYLNISGNKIKDPCFNDIKQPFCSFNLKYLNMSKCSLGDDNALVLGESLASNETIKTMNISSNEISDVGFKSFINLFKNNSTIENFDCSYNYITDSTAKDFIRNLKNNQTLKYLNFYDNQLHDDIGNLFFEVLESNKHLININLYYNRVKYKTIEEINKILKENYDRQKNNFIPDLIRNIKELTIQPDSFENLSRLIIQKKNLQNFLYEKVKQDNKNFNNIIENQNKKLEKEVKKLDELLTEKKTIEKQLMNVISDMDDNDRQRRIKENELNEIIEIEQNNLENIYEENKKILIEYNLVKKELTNVFEKTEIQHKFIMDKYNYAKNFYHIKDSEYNKKYSFYQELLNQKKNSFFHKRKYSGNRNKRHSNCSPSDFSNKERDKDKDNSHNNNNNGLQKSIEEYKSNNGKSGNLKLRSSSKKITLKRPSQKVQFNDIP